MTDKTLAKVQKAFSVFSGAVEYDPATGEFTWKVTTGKARAGAKAGSVGNHGYLVVGFKGVRVLGHRLAWWLVTGEEPSGFIDHINGDRLDNRFANLRVVSRRANNQNLGLQKRNTSGCPNVRQHEQTKRWRAEIRINGKNRHLGYFKTKSEAIAAKKAAERAHGFHPNHGARGAYERA